MSSQSENWTLQQHVKNDQSTNSQLLKTKIQSEQKKLSQNRSNIGELQKRAGQLKQQRADKISELDDLERTIKKYQDHQSMLPLIKQLRAHYRKLKQHMGQGQQDLDVDEMSYQQLLELGDKIGKVSKGISEKQFRQLQRQCCMITQQCSICQDELTLGAQCIKLKCGHMYDTDCLKEWVKMQKICPLCKTEIV